jgi:ribosome recycling factor
MIEPWDKKSLSAIEKALTQADLGAAPTVADDKVRITLPPMSEEQRQKLVSNLKEKAEEAKIAARQDREEAINAAKTEQSEGAISEDELEQAKKEIQDALNSYNTEIDQTVAAKEKEIMTI